MTFFFRERADNEIRKLHYLIPSNCGVCLCVANKMDSSGFCVGVYIPNLQLEKSIKYALTMIHFTHRVLTRNNLLNQHNRIGAWYFGASSK